MNKNLILIQIDFTSSPVGLNMALVFRFLFLPHSCVLDDDAVFLWLFCEFACAICIIRLLEWRSKKFDIALDSWLYSRLYVTDAGSSEIILALRDVMDG